MSAPLSLYYAVKFLTHGQRKEKVRAGINFPALTITRLIRLLVANEWYITVVSHPLLFAFWS